MFQYVFRKWLKRSARKAAYQILMGRLINKRHPECGRFLKHDVDEVLHLIWQKVEEYIPEANLDEIPTIGNRLNVVFAVVTVAAYQSFLEIGIDKDYAIELFADIGWKLYTKMLILPRMIAKIMTRDPQKQINLILRMFMLFPFSTPGRPGYECTVRAESDHFRTDWTYCPPFAFVRRFVETHGNHGEIEAFHRSWCWYDWALTYAMANGGFKKKGHYERPHTLSKGDKVCDMRWYAKIPSSINKI